jgi:putative membrane protein
MRFPLVLLAILLVLVTLLGIHPHSREDWALENALAVAGVLFLVLTYRRMPLSKVSYGLIFIFLVLHEIGAHYTYSEVPYDEWVQHFTGYTLSEHWNLERNHFDRLVHFAYGLLLTYPFREVFVRVANARGFWGYFLPMDLVMSTSMIYELIEWGAAGVMSDELGQAYLGSQGDVWDAHKDMLLATIGAMLAVIISASVNRAFNRDFNKELAESLRVKQPDPLVEGPADLPSN